VIFIFCCCFWAGSTIFQGSPPRQPRVAPGQRPGSRGSRATPQTCAHGLGPPLPCRARIRGRSDAPLSRESRAAYDAEFYTLLDSFVFYHLAPLPCLFLDSFLPSLFLSYPYMLINPCTRGQSKALLRQGKKEEYYVKFNALFNLYYPSPFPSTLPLFLLPFPFSFYPSLPSSSLPSSSLPSSS
jgi:hypothetical protein